MAKIKVTIPEETFIPTLGKGPFLKPIAITSELYRMLTRMGYIVNKITESPKENAEGLDFKEMIEEISEDFAEEMEEIIEEVEEALEDDDEVVVVEEPVEETLEEVEEALQLTDDEINFLRNDAKKAEIKNFFDEIGIEYGKDDTIQELLDIVGLKR